MTEIRAVIKAKHTTSEDGPNVPTGTIVPFGGDALPEGYIWGEGQTLSRYDYPELYAVLKRPLPSWRYPFKRIREIKLRAQHKFRVPDYRGSYPTESKPS